MDLLLSIIVGLLFYALGIALFLRFAGFIHRCDDEMKSMLGKSDRFNGKLRMPARRPSRTKPRFRTA